MALYTGISGKARRVDKLYVGIAGKARQIIKGYVGVGGKAREFYSIEEPIQWCSNITSNISSYGGKFTVVYCLVSGYPGWYINPNIWVEGGSNNYTWTLSGSYPKGVSLYIPTGGMFSSNFIGTPSTLHANYNSPYSCKITCKDVTKNQTLELPVRLWCVSIAYNNSIVTAS